MNGGVDATGIKPCIERDGYVRVHPLLQYRGNWGTTASDKRVYEKAERIDANEKENDPDSAYTWSMRARQAIRSSLQSYFYVLGVLHNADKEKTIMNILDCPLST